MKRKIVSYFYISIFTSHFILSLIHIQMCIRDRFYSNNYYHPTFIFCNPLKILTIITSFHFILKSINTLKSYYYIFIILIPNIQHAINTIRHNKHNIGSMQCIYFSNQNKIIQQRVIIIKIQQISNSLPPWITSLPHTHTSCIIPVSYTHLQIYYRTRIVPSQYIIIVSYITNNSVNKMWLSTGKC